MITPAKIERALLRLDGRRGTDAVAAIVRAPHHALEARCRTNHERRFLAICRAYGIPEPKVNEWIVLDTPAGGLEVDFHWPEVRLVVEVDEDASHHTLRAHRNDPERDRAVAAANWRTLRIPELVLAHPAEAAKRVRRALTLTPY